MPFVFLNELTPDPVEWLIPGRLALGQLHMVDGDPGQGESLVLLDLAARLTRGQPFPDGSPGVGPGTVVIISGEDRPSGTIHDRLMAAGADPGRVVVWVRKPGAPWLRLPSQVQDLDEILARTGARLVILDPVMSFLDANVNVNSDQSVRQALAPLADLAEKYRCAIVMIRHINKEGGGRALYRGLSSIAFNAFCRISWFIGPDPKIAKQFVLAQSKNNLDPAPSSLAYRLTTHASGAAQVEWLGVSSWSEDDVAGVTSVRDSKLRRAGIFLLGFLKDGPRPIREIGPVAGAQGLSNRTLKRAAGELGIRSERVGAYGKDQVTYWLLKHQELPEHLRPKEDEDELDRFFRQLEKQFPSLDPMKEMDGDRD